MFVAARGMRGGAGCLSRALSPCESGSRRRQYVGAEAYQRLGHHFLGQNSKSKKKNEWLKGHQNEKCSSLQINTRAKITWLSTRSKPQWQRHFLCRSYVPDSHISCDISYTTFSLIFIPSRLPRWPVHLVYIVRSAASRYSTLQQLKGSLDLRSRVDHLTFEYAVR